MKIPITNIEKFVRNTIKDIHIPLNFEVFYYNNSNVTYHYLNPSKGCEGIVIVWNSDVFDIKKIVYIREIK